MNDWLIIITAILIVAILADGVRRMHLSRRDKIRVSRKVYKQQTGREEAPPAPDTFTSELPNGGARVISSREARTLSGRQNMSSRDARRSRQSNQGEAVPPVLMEPVEDILMRGVSDDVGYAGPGSARPDQVVSHSSRTSHNSREEFDTDERIEPGFFNESPDHASRERYDEPAAPAPSWTAEPAAADEEPYDDEDDTYSEEDYAPAGEDDYEDYDDEYDEDEDEYDPELDDDYDDEDDYEDDEPQSEADRNDPLIAKNEAARAPQEPDEVLIINIMAQRGTVFPGGDLLDALLKAGLRFGDMNIFHRYSDVKGEGELLFSMANMVKPGTFDLDAMDEFETPGVSLFMTLPLKADSMQSFDLMVDTARDIADGLGGELKDEQRSVMTRQTIDHSRERIRDFERRRLFSRQRRD